MTILSKRLQEEQVRLRRCPVVIGMAWDLLEIGATIEGLERHDDRFTVMDQTYYEMTGDRGLSIGSVYEAVAYHVGGGHE